MSLENSMVGPLLAPANVRGTRMRLRLNNLSTKHIKPVKTAIPEATVMRVEKSDGIMPKSGDNKRFTSQFMSVKS